MSAALRRWAPLLLLAALVVGVRAVLIGGFGSAIPFWDQWDAEARSWLKPWVEGSLGHGHLLAAHNEHRIGWSRLWSLLWFEANGGRWDNLVVALANSLLSGVLAALLYGLLRDGLASRVARAVFFAVVLVLAVVPFGWENLLIGFQSQFQFLALLALVLLAVAAHRDDRASTLALLWGVALLGLPTMATGVLAPVAAGGVLVLRAWTRQWRPGRSALAVAGLAAIAIGGLLAVPVIPLHAALRPHDFGDAWRALGAVLAWPAPGGWWLAPVLWLPSVAFAVRIWRRRGADAHEWLALGLSAWIALQVLAVVWSRGHDLSAAPSRYTDLLAFGTAANAWLALRLHQASGGTSPPRVRHAATVLVVVFLASVGTGLFLGLPAYRHALHDRSALALEQQANVRAFLASGDPQTLVVPHMYIPYPSADRLAGYLQDPTIASMLPEAINGRADAALSAAAARWRAAVRPRFHVQAPAHPEDATRWRLPVADGPATAFQVVDGVELLLELPAPRSGGLASVSLQLGTYGMTLPGRLLVEACTGAECVEGGSALAVAQDNRDLVLVLERPLRLRAGDTLDLRISALGTGHPVAVWLVPAAGGGLTLEARTPEGPRPEVAPLAPRLVLGWLP